MFQLTKAEWESLKLQIETSNGGGGTRYLPYAFTEQGLPMLIGILNSEKAKCSKSETRMYLRYSWCL